MIAPPVSGEVAAGIAPSALPGNLDVMTSAVQVLVAKTAGPDAGSAAQRRYADQVRRLIVPADRSASGGAAVTAAPAAALKVAPVTTPAPVPVPVVPVPAAVPVPVVTPGASAVPVSSVTPDLGGDAALCTETFEYLIRLRAGMERRCAAPRRTETGLTAAERDVTQLLAEKMAGMTAAPAVESVPKTATPTAAEVGRLQEQLRRQEREIAVAAGNAAGLDPHGSAGAPLTDAATPTTGISGLATSADVPTGGAVPSTAAVSEARGVANAAGVPPGGAAFPTTGSPGVATSADVPTGGAAPSAAAVPETRGFAHATGVPTRGAAPAAVGISEELGGASAADGAPDDTALPDADPLEEAIPNPVMSDGRKNVAAEPSTDAAAGRDDSGRALSQPARRAEAAPTGTARPRDGRPQVGQTPRALPRRVRCTELDFIDRIYDQDLWYKDICDAGFGTDSVYYAALIDSSRKVDPADPRHWVVVMSRAFEPLILDPTTQHNLTGRFAMLKRHPINLELRIGPSGPGPEYPADSPRAHAVVEYQKAVNQLRARYAKTELAAFLRQTGNDINEVVVELYREPHPEPGVRNRPPARN